MIFLIIIFTMIFLVITFDIFLLVTILHQLANKAMARDSSWSPEVEPFAPFTPFECAGIKLKE